MGKPRLDLVFWYSAISPYMAERFAALAASGLLDFECWFNRRRNDGRSWIVSDEEMKFPYRFIPEASILNRRVGTPMVAWYDTRPKTLVSFHADLGVAPSVIQGILPRARLVYYLEKTFDTWTTRNQSKEMAKRALFHNADGFLTPGQDADAYLESYGVAASSIHRLEHVVNVDKFSAAIPLRSSNEMISRRLQLGLRGHVFLNVGRMWRQKGIATLLQAFQQVQHSRPDTSLLLVGDGIDRIELQSLARTLDLESVVWIDYVQQSAIVDYFALADSFVFPTRGDPYGLVVDEAAASGLPIISTNMAGEIQSRVIDEKTGFIVPHDDVASLASAMIKMASSDDSAREMGRASFELNQHRDLSHWVTRITDAVSDFNTTS